MITTRDFRCFRAKAYPLLDPNPVGVYDRQLSYTANFSQAIGHFLANGRLSDLNIQTAENPAYDAVNQETATSLAVATAHGMSAPGLRGMSDRLGDLLGPPGFPFQFFFSKQLAAANAARVVAAFMASWAGP